MTPGPKCSICTHDHREQIEAQMIDGRAYVDTCEEFGVSDDALRNHRQRCIPILLKRAHLAADIRKAEWIWNELQRLYQAASAVIDKAEKSGADELAALMADMPPEQREKVIEAASIMSATRADILRAVRTLKPLVELVARMQGELQDAVTVNLHTAPDFVEFRNCILDALEPHHEARLAVGDAMLKYVEARDLGAADHAAVH